MVGHCLDLFFVPIPGVLVHSPVNKPFRWTKVARLVTTSAQLTTFYKYLLNCDTLQPLSHIIISKTYVFSKNIL